MKTVAFEALPIVVGALNTIMGVGKVLLPIAKDAQRVASFGADTSLVTLTASSRVEPLCLVGQDCINLENLPDILQSTLSIFAGYYLQAVAMTMQVNGVSVTKMLDKLNPDRKADALAAGLSLVTTTSGADWRLNSLAYEHRLPTTENIRAMAFENIAIENGINEGTGNPREDYWADKNRREQEAHKQMMADKSAKSASELSQAKSEALDKRPVGAAAIINGNDAIKSIREITDLSVGKLISVTVGGGRDANGKEIRSAIIPISIRLMVNSIADSSLIPLLTSGAIDNSLKERYHAWRAGRIEFIRDLIFCSDLIDENRKAMVSDKSGLQSEIMRRVSNARQAGLADRNPSLNVASNIYVFSEVTAAAIERKLGGSLKSSHTRDKIFNSGYAMIIVVIDRQWDRVSFYHRGISASTTVSMRDIKVGNKGSGPDIGDILKAYQLGSSPSL